MHLKRFRGATVREALQAVRLELGPEALVLSTTMVAARGWRGVVGAREVEITAALDREASASRPAESARRHPNGEQDDITARLVATGLDREMAEEVAAAVPARARRAASPARLREALASRLAELAAVADDYARIEVFVGPPGAGKTTTIAKIAAQERAKGGRRLSLLAADGFRVGAVEQLRTYADILDAPFHVVRTAADLESVLARRHASPVLVDTAGRSPRDESSKELFGVLRRAKGVRTHLVMPADTSPSGVKRIFDGYEEAKPSRLVLTKLDEAESLTPLVSLLRERRLPISYLGTGQRVPEDLSPATPSLLAASVLGEDHHPTKLS